MGDISPDFAPSAFDTQVMRKILKYEGTGKAVRRFAQDSYGMTDYGYWFLLSTLWVSYSGGSDLNEWRRLFTSNRPNRDTNIMKPSELRAFRSLPDFIPCYRAHRPGEADWLSLTLDPKKAGMFAEQRGVDEVSQYLLHKSDALCLFLRRGESELITLRRRKAVFVRTIKVVREEAHV